MEVSANEIKSAQIVTMTTETIPGYLSIARGRNCMKENAEGLPILSACDNQAAGETTKSFVHYIILESGRCLTDNGTGWPETASCNYQDENQQWKAQRTNGTEIRNVATKKCLTTTGLNKPVKMADCSGIPAQYWQLPD